MKHIIAAIAVSLSLGTSAGATDLLNWKKHHKVPTPPVAAQVAPAKQPSTSVSVEYTADNIDKDLDHNNSNYTIGVEHRLGNGAFVAGQVEDKFGTAGQTGLVEGSVGYSFVVLHSIDLKGSVGVGERWQPGDDFSYYVGRLGADIKLTEHVTWNAIQYQYRNAFNTVNDFESHRFGTGLTYNVNSHNAFYGQVFHENDTSIKQDSNGFLLGYKYSF